MLQEQINQDYISAMKARDKVRSTTLNFLRAKIKDVMIEKRIDSLGDEEVIGVIKKQVKQRQDSIEQFGQGGRQDLVDQEMAGLTILEEYLPEQMSDEQIEGIVGEVVKEEGATSMKDMGKVMKAVLVKTGGNADSKIVSEMVKKVLGSL